MWKPNAKRKREVWIKDKNVLVVYWDVNDECGIGFWDDNRNVEAPEHITMFNLLSNNWTQAGKKKPHG